MRLGWGRGYSRPHCYRHDGHGDVRIVHVRDAEHETHHAADDSAETLLADRSPFDQSPKWTLLTRSRRRR